MMASVRSKAFSSDGNLSISGIRFGMTKLWLYLNKKMFKTVLGHFRSITSVDMSPDREFFVTGSDYKKCSIMDRVCPPHAVLCKFN